MTSYIMKSLLLIYVFALVNSQARTLTAKKGNQLEPPSLATAQSIGAADYHRLATPPPPSPKPWISSTPEEILRIYGREEAALPQQAATGSGMAAPENFGKDGGAQPPPSPHHAPPIHPVTGGGAAELRDYGKEGGQVSPPAPQHAPPEHQVSGGGGAGAVGNYGKKGGELPPPSPHHAPPTHQVTGGGGAAELEGSWQHVLLSASA